MRLLLLLLILPITVCRATRPSNLPDYFIRNFTDESGLPQNSVKQLVADPLGFLWLATEANLVRFDGIKFKTFEKSNPEIENQRIVSFNNNLPGGNLYAIGQFGKAFLLKNGVVVPGSPTTRTYLNLLRLNAIDKNKGKRPSRKEIFKEQNLNFKILPVSPGTYYIYYNQQISYINSNNHRWTIPFKGEMSFGDPQVQWSRQIHTVESKPDLNILSFFVIDGQLFFRTGDLGTNFLKIGPVSSENDDNIVLQGDIENIPDYEKHKSETRLIWNQINAQVYAYLNSHFYRVHFTDGKLITQLILKDFDFDKNYIRTAYIRESDGCIFLGSLAKGLFVLTPKSFTTQSIPEQQGDNIFYSHLPYGRSSVVTPQGYVIEPNKTFRRIEQMGNDNFSNKFTFLRDHDGFLWLCRKNTVVKLNAEGKTVINTWQIDQPVKLYQGTNKGIWIGSRGGKLFYLANGNDYHSLPLQITNINKTEITWLEQHDNRHIWIGTVQGLYRLDLTSKKLLSIRGMEKINVRSIYLSAPETMWIATHGNGLFLMEKNRLTKLPADIKKYMNYPHCIVEDKAGYFWIPTNKGLFQVKKNDLFRYAHHTIDEVFYCYYDKSDGFQTNEFNGGCQPCGVKLPDGNISFPSLSGLVWFKPESVQHSSLKDSFIFEDIKLDTTNIVLSDTIVLPYTFSHLSLSISTPYFGNTNNLEFKYQVQTIGSKSQPKWFLAGKDQPISIYNLASGDYLLTVKKVSGFSNQSIEKQIFLHVVTPWFLKWWSYGLTMLFFAGLVFLVVKWRTSYLAELNRELSKRVTERTQELSGALCELQASEQNLHRQLQIQSTIHGVISHDIRSPLRHLSTVTKKLHSQIESDYPDFPHLPIGKSIYLSLDKVFLLTEELLNFIKLTRNESEIIFEAVLLNQVLEQKREMFQEIASVRQTDIILEVPQETYVITNRQLLEIIIHNLLDNAIKSTFKNTITMASHQASGSTVVTITDGGDGMPHEIARWLSSSVNIHGNKPGDAVPCMGLGLIVVKEIAGMLGIKIIVSTAETGTSIELWMKSNMEKI